MTGVLIIDRRIRVRPGVARRRLRPCNQGLGTTKPPEASTSISANRESSLIQRRIQHDGEISRVRCVHVGRCGQPIRSDILIPGLDIVDAFAGRRIRYINLVRFDHRFLSRCGQIVIVVHMIIRNPFGSGAQDAADLLIGADYRHVFKISCENSGVIFRGAWYSKATSTGRR